MSTRDELLLSCGPWWRPGGRGKWPSASVPRSSQRHSAGDGPGPPDGGPVWHEQMPGPTWLCHGVNEYLEGQSHMDCFPDHCWAQMTKRSSPFWLRCWLTPKSPVWRPLQPPDEVALYLLTKETITGDELDALCKRQPKPPSPPPSPRIRRRTDFPVTAAASTTGLSLQQLFGSGEGLYLLLFYQHAYFPSPRDTIPKR